MDDSTKLKVQVGGLFLVCLAMWYITLVVRGHISPATASMGDHFAGGTTSISIGAFAVVAFKKWLWKWRLFRPWLVDVPLVAGRWQGVVHRKYKNGQLSSSCFEVGAVIQQPTISRVRFIQTMKDRSAEGHTEACELYRAADGNFYLEGLYQVTKNEEHIETNGKKEIYYGAMRLQLDDPLHPKELSGSYWSDEFTRGRVMLTREGQK